MTNSNKVKHLIDLKKLLEIVPNRFLLTIAAAKRARQIFEGARPLIDFSISKNRPLDIALYEIQTGKIVISQQDYAEEELIIDEISDYLDSDIMDAAKQPSADTKVKKKSSK